jgi:hypothetical protein
VLLAHILFEVHEVIAALLSSRCLDAFFPCGLRGFLTRTDAATLFKQGDDRADLVHFMPGAVMCKNRINQQLRQSLADNPALIGKLWRKFAAMARPCAFWGQGTANTGRSFRVFVLKLRPAPIARRS